MNRLLVVDDEESIRFALKDFLKGPQSSVDTAQSVEAVKELISAQHIYNGAIVDMRLSGSDDEEGFAVVEMLKETFPKCKIIVATAYAKPHTKRIAMNLGADYFIEKPFSSFEIKKILTALGVIA